MSLHIAATVRRPGFALDVDLTLAAGQTLAVLGPNGSGKSTLLGVLAGLLRPDFGVVRLDGRTLTDTAARVAVPAHLRRVGLLAQQPLLFPHLSVLDNVAFGPRSAGVRRRDARASAHQALTEVDAVEFAARRPARLSGGQAQRIALARALAARPDLLLLDEPLSAVDIDLAPHLRALLRSVLAGRLAVVVTHSVLDAMVLADRVVVLDGGRVVEHGVTREVLTSPRSPFAARLAGLNLVAGTAVAEGLRVDGGPLHGSVIAGQRTDVEPGARAVAVFAPSAVAVHTAAPAGSQRTVLPDVVVGLEPHGDLVRVRFASGVTADVTPAAAAELALQPGSTVWLAIKAAGIAVHPA